MLKEELCVELIVMELLERFTMLEMGEFEEKLTWEVKLILVKLAFSRITGRCALV